MESKMWANRAGRGFGAMVFGVALAVGAGGAFGQPAPGMYATDNAGNFFRIDLLTAAPTPISGGNACSAAGLRVTELEYNNDTGVGIVQDENGAFTYNALNFVTGLPSGPTMPDGAAFNGMEWVNGTLYGTVVFGGGGLSPSQLWTLNPATGATAAIGPTGLNNISGLAYHEASGTLYGVTAGGAPSVLVRINLATGAAAPIANTGVVLGSLEFGPDGLLYGGGGQVNANELYAIDRFTGSATLIGNTGLGANAITGLALVEAPKVFYGVDNMAPTAGDSLVRFEFDDPGSVVVVGEILDTAGAPLRLAGLDFNGDGTVLYGSDSFGATPGAIYRINPATAQATLLGNVGTGILDLAWNPVAGDLFGCDLAGNLWANVDNPAGAINVGAFSIGGLTNIGLAFDSWGRLYVHDINNDVIYHASPGSLTTLSVLHNVPFDATFSQGLFVDWSRDDRGYHAAFNVGTFQAENYTFGTVPSGGGYGPLAAVFAGREIADLTCRPLPPCGFVNPSFETGDFTGWLAQDLLGPFHPLVVDPSTGIDTFGWGWGSAATDGLYTAFHGFDGDGATSGFPIKLAQNVTVQGVRLTFDWRAAWDTTFAAALARRFDVVVRQAGGGVELARINILTVPPGTINLDTGQMTSVVDLSSFKGQTVQVCFEWIVPEDFTGPAQFQFDNVCLSRPCPADLDGDDDTDVLDFSVFAPAFGSVFGDPNYVPAADFNCDLAINVFDFSFFGPQFGCTFP